MATVPYSFNVTNPGAGGAQILDALKKAPAWGEDYVPPYLIILPLNLTTLTDSTSGAESTIAIENKDESLDNIRLQLIQSLNETPIEDGYQHPAEDIIQDAVDNRLDLANIIQTLFIENYKSPAIAAGLLRCIGRLNYKHVRPWGIVVVLGGIRHDDIEVRDAALRALELWGGLEAIDILRNYTDNVKWLENYAKKILKYLQDK